MDALVALIVAGTVGTVATVATVAAAGADRVAVAAVGVGGFLVSDTRSALGRFVRPRPRGTPLVDLTHHLAQRRLVRSPVV